MRTRIIVMLIGLMVFIQSAVLAAPVIPEINAQAACLIEASNNNILYGKNENKMMYPASTTKIVTLLTAIEQGNLKDIVTVSSEAAGCEGSSLDLVEGDKLTLSELLYGMMLVSGNDAAVAVAEHIGGSIDNFADLMNAEAKKAGTTRTHFSNPHGLPDNNHYTTARDLALITAYAYKQPEFVKIVSTTKHTVVFINNDSRTVKNTNKLLTLYPGANGVKTGYTSAAGECLVAAAKRNGVQLIAVIFNSEQRWDDAAKLLDYGFSVKNEM